MDANDVIHMLTQIVGLMILGLFTAGLFKELYK